MAKRTFCSETSLPSLSNRLANTLHDFDCVALELPASRAVYGSGATVFLAVNDVTAGVAAANCGARL
jgi:hypothetical protein